MPIVDVQLVAHEGDQTDCMAASLADALAVVFKAQPGHVWVRLSLLPSSHYAENDFKDATPSAPVFVCVLHADISSPEVLALEARAIAQAVAACVERNSERVHVEYAPPGRGRVAFGGNLLR
jgi:phenylpyruvate tautomerase PptA (4-oxalocrotonate tautomerase family)